MTPPDTIVVPLTHRLHWHGGRDGTRETPVTVPTFVVFTEVQAFAEAWRRNTPDPAIPATSDHAPAGVDEGVAGFGAPGPVVVRREADQRPEHRLSVDASAPQSKEATARTVTSMTTAG